MLYQSNEFKIVIDIKRAYKLIYDRFINKKILILGNFQFGT